VLTGAFADEVASCYAGTASLTEGYVARLTMLGGSDPSFGTNGVYRDPRAVQSEEPAIDPFGRIVYLDRTSSRCGHGESDESVLAGLDTSGHLDPAFGSAGYADIPFSGSSSLAIDGAGRILLLGSTSHPGEHSAQLLRLLPNGVPDPTFGVGGGVSTPYTQHARFRAVGVDGRGRPLLVGFRDKSGHSRFLLRRLTTAGRADRSFGRDGSVLAGFGHHSDSDGEEVIAAPGGGILASGTTSAAGSGIGLARYQSGR
jgi:uncharacterized delta-60 repeat protein